MRTGRPTDGNKRLTALAGALLVTPLAVEGVTILRIGQLLWLHMFVGMLLLGPIALKLASTGFRFVSYYAGRAAYRLKGPPAPALRLLAPLLVLATVVMMGTGVAMMLGGPGTRAPLLIIHKASFIVWLAVTAIHVLAHLPVVAGSLLAERRRSAGRGPRLAALVGAVAAGLVLAAVATPRFAPWQHARVHDDHREEAALPSPRA